MRDEKKINIYGSLQKRQLRNMGYYHGYKGYRYCGSPNQILLYTDFKQIKAVYDFDMKIKSIFYPQIMFLETTIDNCKKISEYIGGCINHNSRSG